MKSNMELSQRRAESVKSYLVEKYGIEPSRLQAKGYGPTRPVADNQTAAGRLRNRRTVAVFETMVQK
jgi:OOP family OmpA-OmpF porin